MEATIYLVLATPLLVLGLSMILRAPAFQRIDEQRLEQRLHREGWPELSEWRRRHLEWAAGLTRHPSHLAVARAGGVLSLGIAATFAWQAGHVALGWPMWPWSPA